MTSPAPAEYSIQRLQEALATDPRTGELGLEVTPTDNGITIRGVVGSEERRAAVLEVAQAKLPGVTINNETTVKQVRAPNAQENIS